MIIAVDGPAASGKGTIARALAAHFGLPHLDTGLLYRAVGVGVARAGGDPDDPADALAACGFSPDLLADPALRAEGAGGLASRVSRHPEVRAALLAMQREFAGRPGGAVLDGRDIGTVIAPHADAKLFVTASPEIRARRRCAELAPDARHEDVLAEIRARDARDSGRTAAPLTRAEDADLLDTSEMTVEEAIGAAIATVERRRARVTRLPWPADFPEVAIHTDVRTRDAHRDYAAAKTGDPEAALRLAIDLINDDAVRVLRDMIGAREPLMLPVIAEETAGFNAIPDAMAQVLGGETENPVSAGEVVQTNKVGHTRARTFQRMVTPPIFAGEIVRGADYVLIDDHVGAGGTLANLRGYVEARGGRVIAMTCLTESRDGRQISMRRETLAMLRERHGHALDGFWRGQFGYGLDCLTEIEAQNLCRQSSVDAIEDRLAQAAIEARGRGLEATPGEGR